MLTLITVSLSVFFIGLTGWMITTYLVKENSQKLIKEELNNLLDICKMFFISLKSLIGVLVKYSFSSDSGETIQPDSNGLDEQPLKIVKPVEEIEAVETIETKGMIPSIESVEEGTTMSSNSPELIEVINEEEEKVA